MNPQCQHKTNIQCKKDATHKVNRTLIMEDGIQKKTRDFYYCTEHVVMFEDVHEHMLPSGARIVNNGIEVITNS